MSTSVMTTANAQMSDLREYSRFLIDSGLIHFNGPVSDFVWFLSDWSTRDMPKSPSFGTRLMSNSTLRAAKSRCYAGNERRLDDDDNAVVYGSRERRTTTFSSCKWLMPAHTPFKINNICSPLNGSSDCNRSYNEPRATNSNTLLKTKSN